VMFLLMSRWQDCTYIGVKGISTTSKNKKERKGVDFGEFIALCEKKKTSFL